MMYTEIDMENKKMRIKIINKKNIKRNNIAPLMENITGLDRYPSFSCQTLREHLL